MITQDDLPNDFNGRITYHYGYIGGLRGVDVYIDDDANEIQVQSQESDSFEGAESDALSQYRKALTEHRAEQRDYIEPSLSAWERNK